jgi:hypothetical protein
MAFAACGSDGVRIGGDGITANAGITSIAVNRTASIDSLFFMFISPFSYLYGYNNVFFEYKGFGIIFYTRLRCVFRRSSR